MKRLRLKLFDGDPGDSRPNKKGKFVSFDDSSGDSDSKPNKTVSDDANPFARNLSDEDKTSTLNHILKPALMNPFGVSYPILLRIAVEHQIGRKPKALLIEVLRHHTCSWACLVRLADAESAGVLRSSTSVSQYQHLGENQLDSALGDSSGHCFGCAGSDVPPRAQGSEGHHQSPCSRRTYFRDKAAARDEQMLQEGQMDCATSWPQVISKDSLKQIMKEFHSHTSSRVLLRRPCSFCNHNERVDDLKSRKIGDLDISLLENAVTVLRVQCNQPAIQSHRLYDGKYYLCRSCYRCVKGGQFVKLPLYSWANGCWIGDLPAELDGLSYAEELVIARAHTTKCWAKINSTSVPYPLRQRSASGNVCVHPHEITTLATTLPRPMSSLYDEIVVIFVSKDREATPDIFKRTPFIVRRGRILHALNWLKNNNPLYHNIVIDLNALAEYPSDDDGCVPFPVQQQSTNDTICGQNATYTGHGVDTTEAIFAESSEVDESGAQIPISTTGTFDLENVEVSLNARKLKILQQLKAGTPFVKTSTSTDTLSMRSNPKVYGMLWPTLFPYGVGMFEDPVLAQKALSFRPIHLRSHVQRYLQLSDRRFQAHMTFPFAMHNILITRESGFKSRLAVRRSWWPKAMTSMTKFDSATLDSLTATMAAKKAKKDRSKYTPANDEEKAVFQLLRYVDYVSDHIEGSQSEIMKMREEIQAISRSCGTLSLFFTLNPADTYNPLATFLAGSDINIDTLFGNSDTRYTSFTRARTLASNPIAGAEFFKLMAEFINTFLGCGRRDKEGVFGRVRHYYGVFEAQNRGSLHMHMLIWLEGALSPKLIHEKAVADKYFKDRLFRWLESIIKFQLPAGTEAVSKSDEKNCLLGRPLHPDHPNFNGLWDQYLREILDASSQVHSHGDTCYKKVPYSMNSLDSKDRDKLCRFNYPADLVPETLMDEHGKISLKRLHQWVVGHNPTISGCFQCNTDLKFCGSGHFAMALSIYMTLYAAKSSLDSPIIMSALAAATKSLQGSDPSAIVSYDDEKCRKLLLKTLNQINGRRELSGQQVACALLGFSNHVTDARFTTIYWSKLLSWLSPEEFPPHAQPKDDVSDPENSANDTSDSAAPGNIETSEHPDESDEEDLIDLNDTMVLLEENTTPPLSSPMYDFLHRPIELENTCMWDQLSLYEKVRLSKHSRGRDELEDDTMEEEDAHLPTRPEKLKIYQFHVDHPQYTTHGLTKRKHHHIPVLSGTPIPRNDLPKHAVKYAIVMLALFRPWNRSKAHPLKTEGASWEVAFQQLISSLPQDKLDIMAHMQEQWECRLAADDFSAEYKSRMAGFGAASNFSSHVDTDTSAELENDLDWQLGQLDEPIGEQEYDEDHYINSVDHLAEYTETCTDFTKRRTEAVIVLAEASNFYHVPPPPSNIQQLLRGKATETPADGRAVEIGKLATLFIAQERAAIIDARKRQAATDGKTTFPPSQPGKSSLQQLPFQPRLTTFDKEMQLARERITRRFNGDPTRWDRLELWKKIAIAISDKFTLNQKQRLAFFLKVNARMSELATSHTDHKPFRLIIGGPGGAGKSHIYDALRMFYKAVEKLPELLFTAPTGVSASNCHGSTIHHALSLRLKPLALTKPNSKSLKQLTERLESVRTLIIDEFFFLGCEDFEKVSRHLNLARACVDDPFGDLDLILSGDEYQLTGPKAIPLFDHRYISVHRENSRLQSLNTGVRSKVTAIKNYWTIENCVILDEVVRQRNPRYTALLNRLRRGMCSVEGEDSDLDYLKNYQLGSPQCTADPDLVNVLRWIQSPEWAAPLITYTNHVRNTHNWLMCQAFAAATTQDFAVYHSQDFVGKGKNKIQLRGRNALDAWNTPTKSQAQDLAGRLPLIINMPVYIIDNIAVELGLSNGSGGTLVSVQYEIHENRRYAISAEVDLPLYTSSDPNAEWPHRITLPLITKSIQFTKVKGGKAYSASRQQLPLTPGFAFTAHNSQSRSLNAGVVHLESCASIAASYVMLSRIKCGEDAVKGLAILGNIDSKNILNHAPQEVRDEEKRLRNLAEKTLANAAEDLSWYIDLTGENFH